LIGKEQPLGQVLPGFAAIALRADLLTHIRVMKVAKQVDSANQLAQMQPCLGQTI
jgi:hypothetical protein